VNQQLKDRVYDVPEDVIKLINHTIAGLQGKNVNGIKRAQTISQQKKVTYGQLKRIIHDLKNIDKVNDKVKYDLYGGSAMEKWANTFLDSERTHVKNKKSSSMAINNNTGLNGVRKNAFRKTHSKTASSKTPVNLLKHNSEKTSVSSLSTVGLFEEIERIKQIIKY